MEESKFTSLDSLLGINNEKEVFSDPSVGDDDEITKVKEMQEAQRKAKANNKKDVDDSDDSEENPKEENEENSDEPKGKEEKKKEDVKNEDSDKKKSKKNSGVDDKGKKIELELDENDDDDKSKNNSGKDEKDDFISSNTKLLFDAIAETAGWDDIEEDKKPKNPSELLDFLSDVVEKNSTPEYASEDVKRLDEFVKNGGDLKQYFTVVSKSSDYDDIDLEIESNQRMIVREYMIEKGISKDVIDKKIKKYEDAGILDDEAEDALEFLKEERAKESQELIKQQKLMAAEQARQQKEFYTGIMSELKSMKDVYGIPITTEDRKSVIDYIFKVGNNGKTKYQEDSSKSARAFLETAIFTMKGGKLIESAKKSGGTSAVDKLKENLAGQSQKKGSTIPRKDEGKKAHIWDMFGQK